MLGDGSSWEGATAGAIGLGIPVFSFCSLKPPRRSSRITGWACIWRSIHRQAENPSLSMNGSMPLQITQASRLMGWAKQVWLAKA
jgi:hypothetical protein